MTKGGAEDPLRELGERLDKARRARSDAERVRERPSGIDTGGSALAFAWRIGIELLVAIGVATGIGWALDRWLGTRPWAMIVLFFLGVAAGMVNVWRAVSGMGMAVGYRPKDGGGTAKNRQDEDED